MESKFKMYFRQFKDGTKTMFKEFFNKKTNKKQRANMWTFSRLVSPFISLILSVISLFTANPALLLGISGVIIGFGGITDFFDGRSARKHNSESEYGKLLDQFTDKVFAMLTSINLIFINPFFISILLGESVISGINLYYNNKYPEAKLKSDFVGKIKQWPLFASLGFGFLSLAFEPAIIITNILLAVTSVLQVITSVKYVNKYKNIEKINSLNPNNNNLTNDQNKIIDEKQKVEILTYQNNKSQQNKTKLELYKDLRDLLNEIKDSKKQEEIIEKVNKKTIN